MTPDDIQAFMDKFWQDFAQDGNLIWDRKYRRSISPTEAENMREALNDEYVEKLANFYDLLSWDEQIIFAHITSNVFPMDEYLDEIQVAALRIMK